MEALEREGREKNREMCNCGCVLSHLIVPLFIVVGRVKPFPLGLQHLIGNLILIGI